MKKIFLSLILLFILPFSSRATEIEWIFNDLYPVTASGFSSIISDARAHFQSNPNDTITVYINEGTYYIDGGNDIGINFNAGLLSASAQGRLIFQGAGMYETTLVFTDKNDDMIKGSDVYHLEFRDMFMTRSQYSVTQGTVVSTAPGQIVLDIAEGFPSPLELFATQDGAGRWNTGRYFKKYDNSNPSDPLIIREEANQQISWGWRNDAPMYPVENPNIPGRWTIYANSANRSLDYYKPGEYVGIKSKSEGHIYWFAGGSDLVFRNIRWRNSSRGLVRGGFSNVGLYGCRIEREDPINGQAPCLSTPSGGPQMNQDGDSVSTNMVVEDCYFDSPGDDNVAFFHVNGGRVKNTVIRNGFARGILATDMASNICLDNVTIDNAYIRNGPLALDHNTAEEAIAAGGAFNDLCVNNGAAELKFASIFSNDMILQRNTSTKIWGTGEPNTSLSITTSWNGQVYNTSINSNGKWEVFVNTPEGSFNAYTVTLQSPSTTPTILTNVVIGEVWLASGQSNMVRPLYTSDTGEADAISYVDDYVRYYKVPRDLSLTARNNIDQVWTTATRAANRGMGAVAFYYGRMLRDNLNMPIGIIHSAYGSSSVEAWLDAESVAKFEWLSIPNAFDGTHDMREPTACYNAMIHGLVGYGIKGAIWYQGETGKSELDLYTPMYYELVNSWRTKWGYDDFPFYTVQIVPYANGDPDISPFWNMQRESMFNIENTGMAVTMDHPSCDQIHPTEKKYVGDRLALWALNKDYGFTEIVPSGPIANQALIESNTVKVYFDYADNGLVATPGGLQGFEIAGANQVYYPATAQINNDNTLTLSSGSVSTPKYVRYGYQDCADLQVSLFNNSELPASAFLIQASTTLGVNDKELSNVHIYPNPVDTKLNIVGFDRDLPIEIYNTIGMLVKRISYQDTIDVSNLTQGLYILKQEELTAKFLKK